MPPLNFKVMPGAPRRPLEKYLFPYLSEGPSPSGSPYPASQPGWKPAGTSPQRLA